MSVSDSAIRGYRVVWLFVMFDLPVHSKPQRKRAAKFRKELLKDGFTMLQFSVYIRHCASRQNADVHVGRVRASVPYEGHVSILGVTDKQYSAIINVDGRRSAPLEKAPAQLEFF